MPAFARSRQFRRGLALQALVALGAAVQAAPHPKQAAPGCQAPWEHAGPTGWSSAGTTEAMVSAGAVQRVVSASYEGNKYILAASVNGGIFRTSDKPTSDYPQWTAVTDSSNVTCLSMAALSTSAFDNAVVLAGCGGSTSSEQGRDWNVLNSGEWAGAMVSRDAGATWAMHEGFPSNYYVTSVLAVSKTQALVGARSNLNDRDDGGIWLCSLTDLTEVCEKTFSKPVFELVSVNGDVYASLPYSPTAVAISPNPHKGKHWLTYSDGIRYPADHTAFYATLTVTAHVPPRLVYGALTVNVNDASDTGSVLYSSPVASGRGAWTQIPLPDNLDEDRMPKDRMAVLADPEKPELLYIAGNAGAVAWRGEWSSGVAWTSLVEDTSNDSCPHVDCRNFHFDVNTGVLLLVSDGGIFARDQPRARGGRWRSFNGNISAMELLTAHYDPHTGGWVGGAQDNCVQLFPSGDASKTAIGAIEGDGTLTAVDPGPNPARLFGSVQFLGGQDSDEPEPHAVGDGGGNSRNDLGDKDFGFGFYEGSMGVAIPAHTHFPDPNPFPFFVQPFTLNAQRRTDLVIFARGHQDRPSGLWTYDIPYGTKTGKDIKPPKLLAATEGDVYSIAVVGDVVAAANGTHFLFASGPAALDARPLPGQFAPPVEFPVDAKTGAPLLGPVSHGPTVVLAVDERSPTTAAVSGWRSTTLNQGDAAIYVTSDAGMTWRNLAGKLASVAGVVGSMRSTGLAFATDASGSNVLLASTPVGVYATWLGGTEGAWSRLGSWDEFPSVLAAGLHYDADADVLVAATMGRGVYRLARVREALEDTRCAREAGSC